MNIKLADRLRSVRRLLLAPRASQIAQAAAHRLEPFEGAARRAQDTALAATGALGSWRRLRAGHPVHQKLRAAEPGLNTLFVQAVRQGLPRGTLRLELTRAGATAAVASVRAEEAPERSGWLAFHFPALGDSAGAHYRWTLAADAPDSGVAVRITNPATGRVEVCPGYYLTRDAIPVVRRRHLELSAAKFTRALDVLREEGATAFTRRVVEHLVGRPVVEAQAQASVLQGAYIARQRWTAAQSAAAYAEQATWAHRPLVSVIVPCFKADAPWLAAAIQSVRAQVYPEWELCAVEDASPEPYHGATRAVLEEAAAADPRVRPLYLPAHLGHAGAANSGLAVARGELVAWLDPDDLLEPHALWEVVRALQDAPDLDIVYTDEHWIDASGQTVQRVFFKPDWSPDRSLSQMYASRLCVYRTCLARAVGGYRDGLPGAEDWDLLLRASEKTERIHHIPRSSYAWRASSGPAVATAQVSARRALEDALRRRGIDGEVEEGLVLGTFRVRRRIQGRPLVSVIVPAHDQRELLRTTVESVLGKSTWPHFELVLVVHHDQDPRLQRMLRRFAEDRRVTLVHGEGPWSQPAAWNLGARRARGEMLLFLAHDVEVIAPGWMEAMIEHAQRPEVGAVGARLLYPTGQVQHAGILLGVGGVAGHAARFLPRQDPGYFGGAKLVQNLSAVSGACMLVRRSVFAEAGGFDAVNLPRAFSDVDLCLRLREKGYLVVYTPYAELYHFESLGQASRAAPEPEAAWMRARWKQLLDRDPYYNPNLTREREDFSLREAVVEAPAR